MKFFCNGCRKTHDDYAWRSVLGKHFCTQFFKPSPPHEYTTEEIHVNRKKYAKSLLQPWRGGEPSAEFIKAYPKQSKKMFTERERIKAREVWKDILPSNWEKSR